MRFIVCSYDKLQGSAMWNIIDINFHNSSISITVGQNANHRYAIGKNIAFRLNLSNHGTNIKVEWYQGNYCERSLCFTHRYPICGPPFFLFSFNSSLLWDVFIINSVEQLQTLPKAQSEIDISPFLKTQKPSSILFYSSIIQHFLLK